MMHSKTVVRSASILITIAGATAGPLSAQEPSGSDELEEITVTGSRIASDGFSAPTPVSVVDSARIEQRAASNIGDLLNELPSFRGTQTPSSQGLTGGYVGARVLDLRGLGTVRTLVLLDGKRIVPSTPQGTVDTNMLPSALLERVEVVTGGASAAYGSDAVSGVVNLILNDKLQGLKSSVEYGQAAEGDDETYVAKVAGGTGFWNDRAHWIGAVEFERNDGVGTCTERQWCADEVLNFGRPAGNTSIPANNILPDVRPSGIAPTGVINSPGPLRGITFNPDGTPRRFVYGTLVNDLFMVGGEGEGVNGFFQGIPIKSPTKRYTLYSRANVGITDTINGHFDIGYGNLEGMHASPEFRTIGANAVTVRRDNPFIPTSTNPALDIRSIMDANNITSFALGRHYPEIGNPTLDSQNEMWRSVLSFDGDIGKSSWGWDAYYQYGRNDFTLDITQSVVSARATRALDAVTNGAGQIVCRVNADANAANDDPACVPMNPFGTQISQGAIDYVTGVSNQSNRTTEHVVAANVQGDVFPTWAGMTSLAVGLEYRSDKVKGSTDPISQTLGFFTGNGQNISGKIDVSEGYIETAIPLAKDLAWARTVDLNGAIRRTQYDRSSASASSDVDATTWKYGLVWEPTEWLRLRGTKSRDIRAPSVSELFGPVTSGFGILTDPRTGLQTNPVVLSGANANLTPEVADTWTAGFVLRPIADSWLGRIQLSVDYFEIDIDDSIGVLGPQTIALRCEQGATEFCPLITRNAAGVITQITDTQQNVNTLSNSGTDLELAYKQPTANLGSFDFRLLYSRVYHLITVDSAGPLDRAGQTGLRGGTIPGIPKYTADALVNWTFGPAQLSLHSRYIPSGIYNAAFIGPDQAGYNVLLNNSTNLNDVPPALYLDTVMQYEFGMGGESNFTVFGGMNNITDKQNPRRPGANGSGNNVLFDPVGRTFKVGFRYQR